MRFVILHYHLFKNAGTSVEETLDRNFGERFHRLDTGDRNGHVTNASLLEFLDAHPDVQAVSSHQIRYPMPAVPGYHFFDLFVLRDPVDRIRSIYDYTREKPAEGDPVSELAMQLTPRRFIERLMDEMPRWCCDVQTRFVAGRCDDELPLGTAELERASRTVLETSFLGVVDRYKQSLLAGEHFLRRVFPGLCCVESMENVTKGLTGTLEQRKAEFREACGAALYDELERRNSCDLALLNVARAEVGRRVRLASA